MAKVGFWLRGASGKFAGASLGKDQKGDTIIRESVAPANPNTVSQIMQRMKLAPAQKFYKALSQLLSNAFEGVKYGEESRQYFMSLCMKKEGGPYIPKGADRFIPADYAFTRGSLPSIGVAPFNGGATQFPLEVAYDGDAVTGDIFAQLIGVANNTQITVCVVANESGIFVPYYIPFSNRLMLKDVPEGTFTVVDGKVAVNPGALGLSTTNLVAFAIAISVQDATGAWLRSTQDMVVSNELKTQLYSPEAMERAIASYTDTKATNSINSEWYYNLGINQPFNGQVTTTTINLAGGAYIILLGVQNINGTIAYTIFSSDPTSNEGKVVGVIGQKATYLDDGGYPIENAEVVQYFSEKGTRVGVEKITAAIIAQSGKDNGLVEEKIAFYYRESEGSCYLVDQEGRYVKIGNKVAVYDEQNMLINSTEEPTSDMLNWGVSTYIINENGTTKIGDYTFDMTSGSGSVDGVVKQYPS